MNKSRRDLVTVIIARDRFIPIIRTDDRRSAAATLESIAAAGAEAIELTATTPGALDLLREYAATVPALGLGSIRSTAQARDAISAGAAFLVTPGVLLGIVEHAHDNDALAIVGGFTPTEITNAWGLGADAVKWFPASIGGVRGLADIRAPLPDIPLIPTGGVDRASAERYLAAGAFAVAVGSALRTERTSVTDATSEWLARCRVSGPEPHRPKARPADERERGI